MMDFSKLIFKVFMTYLVFDMEIFIRIFCIYVYLFLKKNSLLDYLPAPKKNSASFWYAKNYHCIFWY